jgi:hypothetical protein
MKNLAPFLGLDHMITNGVTLMSVRNAGCALELYPHRALLRSQCLFYY